MFNILFWIIAGALSGWIGYLATRTDQGGQARIYLIVGIAGGLIGGLAANILGISDSSNTIDPNSILNALIASALAIIMYVAGVSFFAKGRANKPNAHRHQNA
jgi:uncharacterized membrane protein YeaQ/YmgE (transglycosylase-associated protein family)